MKAPSYSIKILYIVISIILSCGIIAVLISIASPYIGLGQQEDFFFYRLAGWTRSYFFQVGIYLFFVSLVLSLPILWQWPQPVPIIESKIKHIRKYYALPPATEGIAFSSRDQKILLTAGALFQAVYLFIIPLGFECDAAMYFNYAKSLSGAEGGGFTYWKGPGLPAFIALTGQVLFHTFIGTVIAHAVMGVLMPVIFYRTLAPVHRRAAFIAAAILIFSTAPFFAAKLMLTEQLYAFLLVTMLYGFSRYYFTRDVRFIYLTVALGFAAFFTRWEASFPFFVSIGLLFLIARTQQQHFRHLVLAVAAVAVLGTGWSAVRSYAINKDLSLTGSLHNWRGRMSFWYLYWGHMPLLEQWEVRLGWREASDKFLDKTTGMESIIGFEPPPKDKRPFHFVMPENGPATQRLWDVLLDAVTERPESYRNRKRGLGHAQQIPGQPTRDYYWESFGQFEGNPKALVDNIFKNPNGFYTDYMADQVKLQIGLKEMDELFKSVVIETFIAQPRLIPIFIFKGTAHLFSIFGVDIERLFMKNTSNNWRALFPVMAYWMESGWANAWYNIGNCAETNLPLRMQAEIIRDHEVTIPLRHMIFPIGNWMQNLERNAVGLLAILTWWFLPFCPQRRFVLSVSAMIVPYIFLGGFLGIGPHTRWELPLQPLILMVTTLSILGLISFIRKKLEKPG